MIGVGKWIFPAFLGSFRPQSQTQKFRRHSPYRYKGNTKTSLGLTIAGRAPLRSSYRATTARPNAVWVEPSWLQLQLISPRSFSYCFLFNLPHISFRFLSIHFFFLFFFFLSGGRTAALSSCSFILSFFPYLLYHYCSFFFFFLYTYFQNSLLRVYFYFLSVSSLLFFRLRLSSFRHLLTVVSIRVYWFSSSVLSIPISAPTTARAVGGWEPGCGGGWVWRSALGRLE